MIRRRSAFITLLVLTLLLFSQYRSGLTQDATQLPLSEAGSLKASATILTLTDKSRPGHTITIAVWYPAKEAVNFFPEELTPGPAMAKDTMQMKAEASRKSPNIETVEAGQLVEILEVEKRWIHIKFGDASGWVPPDILTNVPTEPDLSGAPYPLIVYSHGMGGNKWEDPGGFSHLVSHGFVVASLSHTCDSQPTCLIDRPLDILFVLDQLAGIKDGEFAGMIASDNVGVMGASYGGYSALSTTGASIDSDALIDWSAHRDKGEVVSIDIFPSAQHFDVLDKWKAITDYRQQFGKLEAGQHWPALTDKRIHAVLANVPAFTTLFGERGAEAATVPTMILAGTEDRVVSYEREIVPLYTHFGAKDHYLISFVGYQHRMDYNKNWGGYYKQFITAFFGYYLQGHKEYAKYLTEDYIADFDDLVWGIYKEE